MNIIAIDPGTRHTGIVYMDERRIIDVKTVAFPSACGVDQYALDERCRKQQVGEGWFATVDDVPKQAISMCVKQIMSSRCIVTVVPHAVKAEAIKNTLAQDINNMVPATIMKSHPHWDLYLDADSAAGFLKL